MLKIYLKPGREKSVRKFHPWIFSGAVERLEGEAQTGAEVAVFSKKDAFLARGFYSKHSQICTRLFRWQDEPVDADFICGRIAEAVRLRKSMIQGETNAYRVINAEGDGLPGLIIDRYADTLVVGFSNAGIENFRSEIVNFLKNEFSPVTIFERSDSQHRREEKLPTIRQTLSGDEVSENVEILENGMRFLADVSGGQKTGFFLDQRDNRALAKTLAQDKSVLNGFAYSGGFTVAALKGGASSVVSVDSSKPALEIARKNMALNDFAVDDAAFVAADMFQYLRENDATYDMIVLDPPAFAKHRRDVGRASRAYKDVNMKAMQRLNSGGLIFTCSCSQHISPDLFQKVLFAAATDANVSAKILLERGHSPDHPINIYHPEGRYLHAFLLQIEK